LSDIRRLRDLFYLDDEGGNLRLFGDTFGELEDLTLDVVGVAPDILQLGGGLLQLLLLGLLAGPLVVLGQVILPQGAKEQEVVGDGQHDQNEDAQDQDVPVVLVH
jgi:hypothetical protein